MASSARDRARQRHSRMTAKTDKTAAATRRAEGAIVQAGWAAKPASLIDVSCVSLSDAQVAGLPRERLSGDLRDRFGFSGILLQNREGRANVLFQFNNF